MYLQEKRGGATTRTANPVFVNADTGGNATGNIQVKFSVKNPNTEVDYDGGIVLTNAFKITPENKSNLKINVVRCGAYVGSNTNPANYKEFMCHNLGADTSADPFTPDAAIQGAKYQWGAQTGEEGRYYSQSDDQSNSGIITGWNSTNKLNGSWSYTSKTANDSCPEGYRVPTSAQWQAVVDNNNVERVGSWNDGNYTTALYFRNTSNIRTLMLPAAGYRYYTNGTLDGRGGFGYYWSSHGATNNTVNQYLISVGD